VSGVSGGYSDFIFQYAAKEIFNIEKVELKYKTLRNKDIREIDLEVDGKKVLSFCTAYGFKNIRNMVQQIKLNKCKYDLIEVMACPGGCTYGAGQIQTENQQVEEIYKSIKEVYPGTQKQVNDLLELWIGSDKEKEKQHFQTQFHKLETETIQTSLKIEW